MKISEKSQLGLQLHLKPVRIQLLNDFRDCADKHIADSEKALGSIRLAITLNEKAKEVRESMDLAGLPDGMDVEGFLRDSALEESGYNEINRDDPYMEPPKEWEYPEKESVEDTMTRFRNTFWNEEGTRHFLIQPSAVHASKMIRVNEGYSSRTLKDVNLGKHTYLMGREKVIRFEVFIGRLDGTYWDASTKRVFQFSCNLEDGSYYYDSGFGVEFAETMRLLTFIELGDIEVVVLEPNRHNGKTVKEGKILNGSPNNVYVVDASWNQLIIRSDGFPVRGHFRLQPCGPDMRDRKLIWIDAYSKNGYTRKPKAAILHD